MVCTNKPLIYFPVSANLKVVEPGSDRCIDENSASKVNYSPLYMALLSPKVHRSNTPVNLGPLYVFPVCFTCTRARGRVRPGVAPLKLKIRDRLRLDPNQPTANLKFKSHATGSAITNTNFSRDGGTPGDFVMGDHL